MATSETTRSRRSRSHRGEAHEARPADRSISERAPPGPAARGTSPKKAEAAPVKTAAKPKTRRSSATSPIRGTTSESSVLPRSSPTAATAMARAPPPRATRALSRRNCLARRARDAPRAERRTISLCRSPMRTSCRLATLTEATSTTTATATKTTRSIARALETSSSRRGTRRTRQPSFDWGSSLAIAAATTFVCSSAFSNETPLRRRAMAPR